MARWGPTPRARQRAGRNLLATLAVLVRVPLCATEGRDSAVAKGVAAVLARSSFLAWRQGGVVWRGTLYPTATVRAGRRLLADKGLAHNGKLFLSGYSQGGHAAMATQRALERDHPFELPVTASSPLAGPYALAKTVLDGFDAPVAGSTIFTPMALIGFQKAYGDVYTAASDVTLFSHKRAGWSSHHILGSAGLACYAR